jgi:predicted transport protein
MEELVLINSKDFFGENALLFKDDAVFRDDHYPDKFLIDFSNPEKPRIYLLEVTFPRQDFGQCFFRITHYFALLRNKNNHNALRYKLHEIINSDKVLKDELQSQIQEETPILEFLRTLLENRPLVLLITSGVISEIPLFLETYSETWGKMFKTLILKKFSDEEEITYLMTPAFADLLKNEKSKSLAIVKSTEEDHLELLTTSIRNIYLEIKTALLETDSLLEFNPKKHYISVRKNKNLAFIQLKRKNIDIVVMNPLESTVELIKHHRIKTLPVSVQKFWNGACCTIVIENSDNLEEVIDLLKVVVWKV